MNKKALKGLAITFILMITVLSLVTVKNFNMRKIAKDIIAKPGIEQCRQVVESSLLDDVAWRNQWINVNGLFQRIIGTTIVKGSNGEYDVYKMSNGQIMYNLDKRNMKPYADKVREFAKSLDDLNIDFTYVQLPYKIKDDSYMPSGTHTYGNANARQMVSLLRKDNIDCISIEEEIERQNLQWDSLFFKTDHHWLPSTGMWATGLIMEHMNGEYGTPYTEKYYDYDNYKAEKYSNYMLGAVGRRVGTLYAGLDDIEIVFPKFDTKFDFTGKADDGKTHRSGKFEDAIYYWDNLANRADFVNNSYSTYIGKEYSINHLKNELNPDGPKILLIRDSFSCVIEPFMGLDASEVCAIDLRRYNEQSVVELCKEYDPDVVIMAYNPSAFSKDQFEFFKNKTN